ncbi:MAG: GLUG motif-containing protein [Bacillota bacterium]
MNNNSRKIRIITIIMLLSLLTTLFSACATTTVTTADYFTAEMPTVESVVGYNVESTTAETESTDSVVKLSETSVWDGTATYDWYNNGSSPYTISSASDLAGLANIVNGADDKTAYSFSGDKIILANDIDLNSGYTFEFDADTGLIAIKKDNSIVAYQGTGIAGDGSGTNSDFDTAASTAGAYYNTSETADGNITARDGNITASTIGLNEWTPIGDYSTTSIYFAGTFDGGGNTISGLYINIESESAVYAGLFGYVKTVDTTATVKNVGVVESSITASASGTSKNAYVGGVVGYSSVYSSAVSNCYNTGVVSGTATNIAYVGGVVGFNTGTVSNCYNTGNVTGIAKTTAYVGGVVGRNFGDSSAVSNCYNTGNVSGTALNYAYVGGVVGYSLSTVSNCYNTGNVSCTGASTAYVGGVVGYSAGTVSNCYNTGTVTGTSATTTAYVGGVAGYNYGGIISNCYNTGNVSCTDASTAYVGGVVGRNYNGGTVSNCYNTGNVTGNDATNAYVGGVVGNNGSSGTVSNCYTYYDEENGTSTLIGGGTTVSEKITNVTTFDSSGNLTDEVTDGTNTETYKTLLLALNAYVDATNKANESVDNYIPLKTWETNTGDNSGYDLNRAPVVFEAEVVEDVEVTTTTTTTTSSNREPLDQYAPTITVDGDVVTIYDQNLASITINGEEIEITDSTMSIDLSEYGNGEHEIVATDKYRRETTMTTTVSIVEEQSETPTTTTAPTPTETPTATVAPTETIETESNQATNNGYAVWIILGAITLGAIGFVIYKKKK